MDNRIWTLRIIFLAFLFIASSSTELHIQQVTEGRGTSDNESYSLDANLGVTRMFREDPPSSKKLTITSFSVVKDRSEVYESFDFEVSGYRWRLVLYLNGNPRDGGSGHISLYVRIISRLEAGTEVNADLKFFIYNGKQKRFKYLTITDIAVKRFTRLETMHGFSRLIPLSTFHNTSEGYIEQDTASFGAEIFIWQPVHMQEKVTFLSNPPNNVFTWTVHNFSNIPKDTYYQSHFFLVGARYWRIGCYPNGRGSNDFLLMYLLAAGPLVSTQTYAQFILRLKNQRSSNHIQVHDSVWFPSRAPTFSPGHNMISLKDLKDASKGYLVNDTIILEAEIVMVSVTNIVSDYVPTF